MNNATLGEIEYIIQEKIKLFGEEQEIVIYNAAGDILARPIFIGQSLADDELVEFE